MAAPERYRFIQVFNRYLQPGGEESSVHRIADDLQACGHEVHRFWRSSTEWNVPGAPPSWKRPLLMWRNPAILRELEQLQAKTGAHAWVLHNVLPVVSLGVYPLALKLRVPIIQWLHNFRPISPSGTLFGTHGLLQPDDPWLAWKEIANGSWNGVILTAWVAMAYGWAKKRRVFDGVRAWIAISEEMRKIFLQARWYPQRVHTLRHSWNFGPLPDPGQDKGYFLFLGRIVETKGIRFLIELWQDPELADIELVVAGQGPLADELRAKSGPHVRWIGQVDGDAKRRWLTQCRAVVFPSTWWEPLGLVTYEAFETAKPVLVSDAGAMKEVVQDRVTGRVLASANREQWKKAILELARSPGAAKDIGRRGRSWLESNVSRESWHAGFMEIMNNAMADG